MRVNHQSSHLAQCCSATATERREVQQKNETSNKRTTDFIEDELEEIKANTVRISMVTLVCASTLVESKQLFRYYDKMIWLSVLHLLMLPCTGWADLLPPQRSYKVLMLLPISSKSHRNVIMPLAEALADRGHKVDMLSSYNIQHQNTNIREIPHGLPHFPDTKLNLFNEVKKATGVISLFKDRMCKMARDIYRVPQVKELYMKRKEYDLIVLDHLFNEFSYPFVHEMPFITIATNGMDPRQSAVLGNLQSPAYMPSFLYDPNLEHVFGRLANAVASIVVPFYWRYWDAIPAIQKEVNEHFPDLPPLLEIERNQSLVLLNSHFSIGLTVPVLPSQVEVGGMHCRPPKPLPEDLDSWIEGAGSAGVIYFSLGSVTKGNTLPVKYRNMFIEAFSKLNQRILWKFETGIEGIPENVMINHWFPQQDILAHPNVKGFISHGGLLSLQEALFHGTPMVVLPLFGDQPTNAARVVANGWGRSLDYKDLSVDLIISSILEVMNNTNIYAAVSFTQIIPCGLLLLHNSFQNLVCVLLLIVGTVSHTCPLHNRPRHQALFLLQIYHKFQAPVDITTWSLPSSTWHSP
ncbi:UDP-glycosyltransferase UGT5-like isoform X2 [Macrobrachium nipponense]|uniref:UDP-glycosyltransferase UGT5-like isoform X2 n=1 Tax=Macrobrachium nipponense TaxID=159736 RepID=UPI0030C879F8